MSQDPRIQAPKGINLFRISENSAFTRVANYSGYRPAPLFQPGPLNLGELSPESGGGGAEARQTGADRNLLEDFGVRTPSPGGGAGLADLPRGQPAPSTPLPFLPMSPQGGGISPLPFIYGSLQ